MNDEEKIINIINTIKPFINSDGGDIEFVKYEDNYLYIKLSGACQNCMYQDNTINDGIFEFFKAEVPELEGVININL